MLHYVACGRLWEGATCSHRVWEQFADMFETYVYVRVRVNTFCKSRCMYIIVRCDNYTQDTRMFFLWTFDLGDCFKYCILHLLMCVLILLYMFDEIVLRVVPNRTMVHDMASQEIPPVIMGPEGEGVPSQAVKTKKKAH